MAAYTVLSSTEEFESVDDSHEIIIEFGSSSCAPCRGIRNALHRMNEERPDCTIVEVDVDTFPEIAKRYGVRGIPVLVLQKHKQVLGRLVGGRGFHEIAAWVDAPVGQEGYQMREDQN